MQDFLVYPPWLRILKTIREEESIAQTSGNNILLYKLQSFMLRKRF